MVEMVRGKKRVGEVGRDVREGKEMKEAEKDVKCEVGDRERKRRY